MTIPLTFFSLPRAFIGEFIWIQRNAVLSWKFSCPNSEIILFGQEKGTQQMARETRAEYHRQIYSNNFGTPYIHTIFEDAQKVSVADTLCYLNADMILLNNLEGLAILARQTFDQFLLVACRWDLRLAREINFKENWKTILRSELRGQGRAPSPSFGGGIDCFVFSRDLFPATDFPAFLLGREVWDAWIVTDAINRGIPVVDIGTEVIVIHQTHTRPEDSFDSQQVRDELRYNSRLYRSCYREQLKVPDSTFVLQNGEFKEK